MPTRRASVAWEGGLRGGRGTYKGETGLSGNYTFGSRFEQGTGSNPEELLAAALASCFSMALAGRLERAGHAPERVETDAACTIEKVGEGFKVTGMTLRTRGTVPGMDPDAFRREAEEAKNGCPISQTLRGNVPIELHAELE